MLEQSPGERYLLQSWLLMIVENIILFKVIETTEQALGLQKSFGIYAYRYYRSRHTDRPIMKIGECRLFAESH